MTLFIGTIVSWVADYTGLMLGGFIVVTSIIIGVASNYLSSKKRILRYLKKSPAKPINSVKNGERVRLHGSAKFLDIPLTAPLSGRKCVYYHVTVEQKGSKNSWHGVISEFNNQDFYLQVGDELALIKAQAKHRTLYHLVTDHNQRSGWRNDANSQMEALLKKHGKRSTTMLFNANKTMRYKEAIIAEDEQIVVKGIGKWEALQRPIAGFSYSRILTLSSSQSEKLIITDEPKALKILHEKP